MARNSTQAPPPPPDPSEAPPVGRSWGPLYAVVLAFLALTIAGLALFTRAFR